MEKTIRNVRYLLYIAFLLCVVFFIVSFFRNNKIVATAEGNRIYYNGETYVESFEVFDFDRDRCLGSVKIFEDGLRHRMYSLRERPGYVYVDMWLDHRLYVRAADE